ncbi:hypothetical protein ACFSW8_01305 [Rubritalea tangerina]|uniref:BON domain-containing protein n=2 Tax=Rubritalea tangerina TaxID=430798 RepID=A0ABW4Z6N2_9BACT
MNPVYHNTHNRRSFIKKTTTLAGTLSLAPSFLWAHSSNDPSAEFHVAFLSDPHIPEDPNDGWNGFLPIDNMQKVIPNVLKSQAQATIINGDAARLIGTVADYQVLKRLLQPVAAINLILRSSEGTLRATKNLAVSGMIEAVRDQTKIVDTKQINAVLMQPHWRHNQQLEPVQPIAMTNKEKNK